MKKIIFLLINILNLLAIDCTKLVSFNNHKYIITSNKLTFTQAKIVAENEGGYLAIPDSEEENNFLKNLIGGNAEAWIGVYDPNLISNYCYSNDDCLYDDKRFETIKAEGLIYSNWAYHQPDNLVRAYDVVNEKSMVSPLGEHWVVINGNDGKWFDVGNHADLSNNPYKAFAIIEFDGKIDNCSIYEDDPNSDINFETPKCNTKIYEDKIDKVLQGETYDCQQDKYNTWYCPEGLAEAREYWSYDSGWSKSGIGTTTDYKDKITTTIYKKPNTVISLQKKVDTVYYGNCYISNSYGSWSDVNSIQIKKASIYRYCPDG